MVTKSHDHTSLEWFFRKVCQFWLEGCVGWAYRIYFWMVLLATLICSFKSSPRILSALQSGFLAAISLIRSMVSWDILGWEFFGGFDFSFQNSRNPCRCQRRSVSGLRISKACFQFARLLASTTNKKRSKEVKEGFLTWRFKIISCFLSKTFSAINSDLDLGRSLTAPAAREDLAGFVQAINPFWTIEQIRLQQWVIVRTKNFISAWLPFLK